VLVVLACGCKSPPSRSTNDGGETATTPDAGPVLSTETVPASTSAASASAPSPRSASLQAGPCSDAAPRSGKSIGHTSTVFKLELADGRKVAWKPNSKKVHARYKGEIAAFRLASALGIDNVLPACARAFDVNAITSALSANADASNVLTTEAVAEDGKVYGATIDWFDGLSFWPLEKEPLRSEARSWLTAGHEIPPPKVDLARQTSTLVAFDFITGNWDRYSGENVGIDRAGVRVLYIDNDAAFMEAPPKAGETKNETALKATDRFSRAFVERVRNLDAEALSRVFGVEAPGRPLLAPSVVGLVVRRLKALVAIVDRKIALHGEGETLYFR
jgi:hypothetical protein